MSLATDELYLKVVRIIEEASEISRSEIEPESAFIEDLDFDSLTLVEIGVLVEERFGIQPLDSEITRLTTVRALVDYVRELVGSDHPGDE